LSSRRLNLKSKFLSLAAFAASGTRRYARVLLWFLFLYVLGWACFVSHGVAFHLTPWSQAVVNGIVKLWYPDKDRDKTTVVLFREENLKNLKKDPKEPDETYPVSYKRHAEVLEALLAYKPRAVFVDFMFIDKRTNDDITELGNAICKLTNADPPIPVYLAAPPLAENRAKGEPHTKTESAERSLTSKVRKELLACPSGINPELVSAQMESEYGVSGVLEYKLEGKTAYGKKDSPALAMLDGDLKKDVKSNSIEDPIDPMDIVWASPTGQPLTLNMWMGCESNDSLKDLLQKGPLANRLNCPYTPTISVRHLLRSIGGSIGDDKDEVSQALGDRAVFYGAGFQGAGDIVVSPVYAELPGVYLHAMAYDNLLTLRNNYKRAENTAISWAFNFVVLFFIVCILLFPEKIIRWLTARSRDIFVFVLDLIGFHQRWRRLPNSLLRWLPLGIAAIWAAFLFFIGQVWNPSGHAWNEFVWSSVLGVSLLVGVFALSYLDSCRTQDRNETQREFHEHLAALIGPMLVGGGFLLVYILSELEAALLFSVGFYFIYKLVFAKDQLFVVAAILMVIASLVSFWPGNLGPRNIIAYLLFFEVARHLLEHAREVAEKYHRIQRLHTAEKWGWWGRGRLRFNLLKLFCQFCDWEGKDEYRNKLTTSRNVERAVANGGKRGVG
jgi:CHASE2 domain-containing sensor protein